MNNERITYPTLEAIENIIFELVSYYLQFDQPLPNFDTADKQKLESILSGLKQTVEGKEVYPSLIDKASVLFYRIIKEHPFLNGNKRMAIISTYYFLRINGMRLLMPWQSFYYMSRIVAQTHPKEYDEVLVFIYDIFMDNLEET